jgi:ATP synthase protein I
MQANDMRLLKGAVVPTVLVGLVVIGVAALLAGFEGALGAAIGTLVVCVFFALGIVAVSYAGRVSPMMMMTAAVLTYAVKIIIVMALLKTFEDATAFEPKAFGWAVIVCTIAWTVGEMRGFMKLKMLYVDPDAPVPGQGGPR